MLKSILILFIYSLSLGVSQGQNASLPKKDSTDIIEVSIKAFHIKIKEKPAGKKKVAFSIIPIATTSSGGTKFFVSSVSAAFILGNPDSTNVSSVYLVPYTDFASNFSIAARVNIWTASNRYNIPGIFRFGTIDQYSYGLGSGSKTSNQFTLRYNNVRLYGAANRKIGRYFYAGPGLEYDRYYNIQEKDVTSTPSEFQKYGIGTGSSSFSTGITFNLLRDNRKNSINPNQGFYTSISVRTNPNWLENSNQWSSVYIDSRKYFSLDKNKRKIIAVWAMYWGSYGQVPYLNLPGTSLETNARSGRGYIQGRFRGKQMLYLETEYRFDITANGLFGGVIFANAESLSEPNSNQFKYVNPALGFGARVKFNKNSRTNFTLDLGIGQDSTLVYLGLGEFF